MFLQHMIASCKPGGMVVSVMPHGVLFRGGEEKKIRENILGKAPFKDDIRKQNIVITAEHLATEITVLFPDDYEDYEQTNTATGSRRLWRVRQLMVSR